MKIRITYIISLVHKANIFEWTALELDKERFEQHFILLHDRETEFERDMTVHGFHVQRVHYRGKRDMFRTVFTLLRIFRKVKPDIVHTHLFDAGVAGMFAAWLKRIPKRIHTRHDATVNHVYYPHAVKWDRFTNRYATHIIAITDSVKHILMEMEHVPEKKISVIHHGFRLDFFARRDEKAIAALKEKYITPGCSGPVVGVISRYIHWKGIQYTIEAFRSFLRSHPGAYLMLCNAQGPYEHEIKELLKELPASSYREIIFEHDIVSLYHLFDVFVHVPIDEKAEAFGQIYVETMAASVPAVVTLSGIAKDYIIHRRNALVVPFSDSSAIHDALNELLSDETLRKQILENGRKDVAERFSIKMHVKKLQQLYLGSPER